MNIIQKIYKRYGKNRWLTNIFSWLYTRVFPVLQMNKMAPKLAGEKGELLLAVVCDEMTWQELKRECQVLFITPQNWRQAFKQYRPAFFFCESAWNGIDGAGSCWRGQVYKNSKLCYNNRRELFRILDYCKLNGIPSVFWNKEDPVYFGNEEYNFVDTALHFDYILTTAIECVPWYKALGADNVHLWMFGFSPEIYYPPKGVNWEERQNVAVFAGSWYADHPKRCQDMIELFDMVLDKGIDLVIYDRWADNVDSLRQYPDKYRRFVRPAVKYEELGDIYRRVRYVVNINTVTHSKTMFARRVFEAMACGCIVVSNASVGMQDLFSDRVWFTGQEFDVSRAAEIAAQNEKSVRESHSFARRIAQLWELVG